MCVGSGCRYSGAAVLKERSVIKSDLIAVLVSEHVELHARDIDKIIVTFFDEIAARLAADGRVELRGFGIFSTRARDARTIRNPGTGEPVKVGAKRVPHFKAGKNLRARIRAGHRF